MKNKVLVTGGAGFLGSHLCKFLLDRGDKVVCLDNFFTGREENIINLEENFGNSRFNVISHDITDPLIPIKENIGRVNRIYNLACPASPIHYQFDPIETGKASVIGSYNVLDLARLNGARVLQASTSEVYGDPLEHPQRESYRGNVNTLGPRSCYDEGKRMAETIFKDYNRKFNLSTRIARIFNTYGPNMHQNDGRVISNFVTQALKNEPITIYGDGNQTRSFCYVDDMSRGLYSLMESDINEPVNLGNPEEYTMNGLAKKVIELTNSKSKIVYNSLPEDDPKQRKPDIGLAKKVLNWEPQIPLNQGLAKTIEYFKTTFLEI